MQPSDPIHRLDDLYAKNQIISNQSESIDHFIDDFANRSDYHKIVTDLVGYISKKLDQGLLCQKDEILSHIKEHKIIQNYKDLFAVGDKLYQFKYKFENIKNTINNIRSKSGLNQEIADALNLKKELQGIGVTISESDYSQTILVNTLETEIYDKIDNIKKSIKILESTFVGPIMRSFDSRFENIYHNYLYINDQLQGTHWSSKVARLFVDEFMRDDSLFEGDINNLPRDLKDQFYNYLASKEFANKQNNRKIQDTEGDRSFFKNQKTLFEKLTREYEKNQKTDEDLLEDDISDSEKEPIRQDIIKNIYKIWTTKYFSRRDTGN